MAKASAGHHGQEGEGAQGPPRAEQEVGGGQAGPEDRVAVGEGDEAQEERRAQRPAAAGIRAVADAEEEHRETDAVGVGELPGEGARDGPAPDRVVLVEQEDRCGPRAHERPREAEAHEPEGRVGQEGKQEHGQGGPELEGDRHARRTGTGPT